MLFLYFLISVLMKVVGRDGGGGITGSGYLRLPPSENSQTIHYKQACYETVSGEGVEAEVKGERLVVGVGRLRLGGDLYGIFIGIHIRIRKSNTSH